MDILNTQIDRCMHAKLLQSCPTLCDPMDYSPPGSSVYGFLQARILEWVAPPLLQGNFPDPGQTHISLSVLQWQADSLSLAPPD